MKPNQFVFLFVGLLAAAVSIATMTNAETVDGDELFLRPGREYREQHEG